jgi:hypothetical protein
MRTYLVVTIQSGKEVIIGRRAFGTAHLRKLTAAYSVVGYTEVTHRVKSNATRKIGLLY